MWTLVSKSIAARAALRSSGMQTVSGSGAAAGTSVHSTLAKQARKE